MDEDKAVGIEGVTKEEYSRNLFTFLGFTHYCSKGRNGKFRVKRKTSKKKFAKKCKEIHRLIGSMRTLTIKEITSRLNRILVGYLAFDAGYIDESQGNTIWANMIARKRKNLDMHHFRIILQSIRVSS